MKYIPSGDDDREKMLNQMNVKSFEDLIKHIPENLKNRKSNIDKGISEYELMKQAKKIAAENNGTASMMSFMGCGVYDHYIPPAIRHIVLRPEFYTAYTPYQSEVSQGTLQVIYEFQSMISEMYSMDISNASMYDGSTATAEACHMAMDITRKKKIILSDLIHPIIKEVINTYLTGQNIEYQFVKSKNGLLDIEDLRKKVDNETAAFVLQTPNFLGFIENMDEISAIVKKTKALFIVNQNPMSLGILKSPGFYNADIAVGEAQVLGISQAFGGPLLGIFTSKKEYARKMPGRIIGKTVDTKGRDGYVMTMQTREQHIRREKATSNICTNEGLCLLMSTIYLELLGKNGFYQVSKDSALSAHYLRDQLNEINGIEILLPENEFYNEFPVKINNLTKTYKSMKDKGFLMGVKLERFGEEYKDMLLIASTEKRSKEDIDKFIKVLRGVIK